MGPTFQSNNWILFWLADTDLQTISQIQQWLFSIQFQKQLVSPYKAVFDSNLGKGTSQYPAGGGPTGGGERGHVPLPTLVTCYNTIQQMWVWLFWGGASLSTQDTVVSFVSEFRDVR